MNRHVTDGLHRYPSAGQLHKIEIRFASAKFGVKSCSSYKGTGRPLLCDVSARSAHRSPRSQLSISRGHYSINAI